jgi:hypothetical protein
MASDDVMAGEGSEAKVADDLETQAVDNNAGIVRDGFTRIELHHKGARAFVDLPDDTYGAIRDFEYIFDDLENAIDSVLTEQTGQ